MAIKRRYRTGRDFRRQISKAECVKRYRARARALLLAEEALNRASDRYDDIVQIARDNGWKLPRNVMCNPLR